MQSTLGKVIPVILLLLILSTAALYAEHVYSYDFESPMSWADDVAPIANFAVQEWEIADGGNPGKALRINGATYDRTNTLEIRTIQFSHKSGTPVTISFDFKAASNPTGSYFMTRYFDGYCTGQAFYHVADDKRNPFPKPFYDTREAKVNNGWQHVSFTTPPLKNTVVTFAFYARQDGPNDVTPKVFLDYYLDNLKVGATLNTELADPDFNWHGNYGGNTMDFRRNTLAADSDWADFADQELGSSPWGPIRYTLFQFRDQSTQEIPGNRHHLRHEQHAYNAGGVSTITLFRHQGAGDLSAVSWGVRQTVGYESLGLAPGEKARIRVSMKVTSVRQGNLACRLQLGVDPYGQLVTQKALWTKEDSPGGYVDVRKDKEMWKTLEMEFDRPADADGFTVYFRQRDGIVKNAKDTSYPPPPAEAQSQGSWPACESFADWVMVEVIK